LINNVKIISMTFLHQVLLSTCLLSSNRSYCKVNINLLNKVNKHFQNQIPFYPTTKTHRDWFFKEREVMKIV